VGVSLAVVVCLHLQLENILLAEKENASTIKLSDFGVAAILQESDKDETKTSVRDGTRFRPIMFSHVGSVAYMGESNNRLFVVFKKVK